MLVTIRINDDVKIYVIMNFSSNLQQRYYKLRKRLEKKLYENYENIEIF